MKSLALLTLALLLGAGCASNMRYTLADLDMRKADQITAGQYDAGVVFESRKGVGPLSATAPTKAVPPSFYEKAIEVLPKLRWRFRILVIESSPAFAPVQPQTQASPFMMRPEFQSEVVPVPYIVPK